MTERDPVADFKAAVYAAGYAAGRRDPTVRSRVLHLVVGAILGAIGVLWSAGALGQVPPAAEVYRRDLTRTAVAVWGLDAPVSSLAAQLHAESAWRPDAVSWAGAAGLAQFMARTADDVARQYPELSPPNRFDPRWAMRAQSTLMRELFDGHYGWDDCERYGKATASYNQGPRWTRRAEDLADDPTRWFGDVEHINPGKASSAYRETFGYVRRILLTLTPVYVDAGWGRGHCSRLWRY